MFVGRASLRAVERGQVCAYPPGTRLPHMQPGADRAHRRHASGREPDRECLRSLTLQRIGIGHALRRPAHGWHGSRCLGRADDHHEQLVRADQRDRRPRGHRRARQAVPETVGDIRRQRRRDAQPERSWACSYDATAATTATPMTATAVVHLITRSAAITEHHQRQKTWSGQLRHHAQLVGLAPRTRAYVHAESSRTDPNLPGVSDGRLRTSRREGIQTMPGQGCPSAELLRQGSFAAAALGPGLHAAQHGVRLDLGPSDDEPPPWVVSQDGSVVDPHKAAGLGEPIASQGRPQVIP